MYDDGVVSSKNGNGRNVDAANKGLYHNFASYYVDDKENLKEIMRQLGELGDDEERIKEELYLLLSFFILTYERRQQRIQSILLKNKDNLISIIENFHSVVEDEDTKSLMEVLAAKMRNLSDDE